MLLETYNLHKDTENTTVLRNVVRNSTDHLQKEEDTLQLAYRT